MNPRFRPLLLALGALAFGAASASAQLIELVTEAPVTFQITLTTTATTTTATERRTTQTVSKVTQANVIQELVDANIINAPASAWRLVAVNHAPADLAYVTGAFHLYAVNGENRVRVPSDKFSAAAFFSAGKYKEQHLGQYVLNSAGTETNHVKFDYTPTFSATGITFDITQGTTDGYSAVTYKTKDAADGFEVFFYAINSARAINRGGFRATTSVGAREGLMSITANLGAAKLVPASLYPAVPFFPSHSAP